MAVCCCSLADTAACRTCANNPDAEMPRWRELIVSTGTTPIISVKQVELTKESIDAVAEAVLQKLREAKGEDG